jgi:hypothetical protein
VNSHVPNETDKSTESLLTFPGKRDLHVEVHLPRREGQKKTAAEDILSLVAAAAPESGTGHFLSRHKQRVRHWCTECPQN